MSTGLNVGSGARQTTPVGCCSMDHSEFEARVGTKLRGKWELKRLIGVGGMAAVYVGRHKIGRDAAIKVLHPEISVDKGVRDRFEQEALAVNSIGHPGVVEILDIDETEDGNPFLVMELLEGETLADRVERAVLPKLSYLLDMTDQLLDVLVACHKKGIIHRDIKPENLFIQKNGKLKVLDFGVARVREGVRTVVGTMLGTVAFMPPEQLKGLDVDHRADIFSVGATMFSVLADRGIHVVESDSQLAMKMLSTPAPNLASVTNDVPERVCMVVDRALAYLPDRRYPDAQTMRGDVWALQRKDHPPYARACIAADLDPHVLTLPEKTKGKLRTTGELPATDPQMPAFAAKNAGLPATDPQMPAFADHEDDGEQPAALATKPDHKVVTEDDAEVSGDDEQDGDDEALAEELAEDGTNKEWPAEPKRKKTKKKTASDSPPDDAEPLSDPPPSKPPISAPPDVDPAYVARKKSGGSASWVVLLVLVALGVGAAWWTGVIPGRKSPKKPAPTSTAAPTSTGAPATAAPAK
jgi:serine/threonine protein kinase